ncbi:MAG: hypothetical protein B6I25_02235 [Planctomycetales bacterium 4572_13]|nr:MAG: hypothetical protein B6I25_02235 [Planctomycetales bacterium 4572_13]
MFVIWYTYITLEELLVIESGTTDVAEGGNTDSFNISLGYEPNYDVTVSLADTAATNQVTLSDYTLVFTDSSGATPWNEAQTVTVTAVDDAILEDEIHTTTLSIDTTSSDAAFNGLSDSVVVNITDDEGITGIYVDANDTNTDANDGTALWFVTPPVVDDGLWGRRTDEPDVQEEGDFYETSNSEDVLLLKTTLSGLHPCHPYDIRIITVADTTASWSINAGFDPCSLASYSWDSPTARLTGKYDSGNLAQFEALIGRGMTDYNGVLVVYIDSSGTDTWYDGLSYEVGGIVIETVTVGDIENAGESSGGGSLGESRICGAVDYVYEIGKFEITAGQYAAFLNAVAATDTYGLYYAGMDTTFGCKIEQRPGSYNHRGRLIHSKRSGNL